MSNKLLYIYYFSLVLILALYTNMGSSPNAVIRSAYLVALLVPMINKPELLPGVMICVLSIARNSFAYPIIPTDIYFHVTIALFFAVLSLHRHNYITGTNYLFLIALIYVSIHDWLILGVLSPMALMFVIFTAYFMCVERITEIGKDFLTLAFLVLALSISFWVLFRPETQQAVKDAEENMHEYSWTDANYFSLFLGTGIVVAVMNLMSGYVNKLYAAISLFSAVIVSMALLTLASRGAILATIIAIAAMYLLSQQGKWKKFYVTIIVAIFIFLLYTNQYFDLAISRFGEEDGSGTGRTQIWAAKFEAFSLDSNLFDWIFGIGQKAGILLGRNEGVLGGKGMSTHNDYLSILFYYGIVGVILFFSALAYPLRICTKAVRPYILALLLFLMTCSMTIEPFARGSVAYWGLFFFIIIYARQSRFSKKNKGIYE